MKNYTNGIILKASASISIGVWGVILRCENMKQKDRVFEDLRAVYVELNNLYLADDETNHFKVRCCGFLCGPKTGTLVLHKRYLRLWMDQILDDLGRS